MAISYLASTDLAQPLTLDAAEQYIHESALTDSVVGRVGLELETHLVDLSAVARRPDWARVAAAAQAVGSPPGGSLVTLEPGGQLELSGPPAADLLGAVDALRVDEQRARLILGERQLGLAHVGADPLRPPRRINPRPRYAAMQQHFEATAQARAGAAMMCSTAALQVNLEAGPACGWRARVRLAHQLGPTLVALSACSPWLTGRATGWKSARQQVWAELDSRRCGPLLGRDEPATEWTRYAMQAPVMFIGSGDDAALAVQRIVPFQNWVSGLAQLDERAPTIADLQTHLTTLFPPVRLRGFLELRYLDACAPRWWPALAAVTAVLMDDPAAADAAAEATEATARRWSEAARDGLDDPRLAESARRCVAIAADRVAPELAAAVADLADLVDSGRCPGDLVAERIADIGPGAALEELAHA
ncbi:MAG: ergothioneine biosynthesis glutamate--cysteine ligase EgtA [Pseudonocardiales bacterium]